MPVVIWNIFLTHYLFDNDSSFFNQQYFWLKIVLSEEYN